MLDGITHLTRTKAPARSTKHGASPDGSVDQRKIPIRRHTEQALTVAGVRPYADMIPRIQALAENPDVPAVTRAPMMQVLENHQHYLTTRKHIED